MDSDIYAEKNFEEQFSSLKINSNDGDISGISSDFPQTPYEELENMDALSCPMDEVVSGWKQITQNNELILNNKSSETAAVNIGTKLQLMCTNENEVAESSSGLIPIFPAKELLLCSDQCCLLLEDDYISLHDFLDYFSDEEIVVPHLIMFGTREKIPSHFFKGQYQLRVTSESKTDKFLSTVFFLMCSSTDHFLPKKYYGILQHFLKNLNVHWIPSVQELVGVIANMGVDIPVKLQRFLEWPKKKGHRTPPPQHSHRTNFDLLVKTLNTVFHCQKSFAQEFLDAAIILLFYMSTERMLSLQRRHISHTIESLLQCYPMENPSGHLVDLLSNVFFCDLANDIRSLQFKVTYCGLLKLNGLSLKLKKAMAFSFIQDLLLPQVTVELSNDSPLKPRNVLSSLCVHDFASLPKYKLYALLTFVDICVCGGEVDPKYIRDVLNIQHIIQEINPRCRFRQADIESAALSCMIDVKLSNWQDVLANYMPNQLDNSLHRSQWSLSGRSFISEE